MLSCKIHGKEKQINKTEYVFHIQNLILKFNALLYIIRDNVDKNICGLCNLLKNYHDKKLDNMKYQFRVSSDTVRIIISLYDCDS